MTFGKGSALDAPGRVSPPGSPPFLHFSEGSEGARQGPDPLDRFILAAPHGAPRQSPEPFATFWGPVELASPTRVQAVAAGPKNGTAHKNGNSPRISAHQLLPPSALSGVFQSAQTEERAWRDETPWARISLHNTLVGVAFNEIFSGQSSSVDVQRAAFVETSDWVLGRLSTPPARNSADQFNDMVKTHRILLEGLDAQLTHHTPPLPRSEATKIAEWRHALNELIQVLQTMRNGVDWFEIARALSDYADALARLQIFPEVAKGYAFLILRIARVDRETDSQFREYLPEVSKATDHLWSLARVVDRNKTEARNWMRRGWILRMSFYASLSEDARATRRPTLLRTAVIAHWLGAINDTELRSSLLLIRMLAPPDFSIDGLLTNEPEWRQTLLSLGVEEGDLRFSTMRELLASLQTLWNEAGAIQAEVNKINAAFEQARGLETAGEAALAGAERLLQSKALDTSAIQTALQQAENALKQAQTYHRNLRSTTMPFAVLPLGTESPLWDTRRDAEAATEIGRTLLRLEGARTKLRARIATPPPPKLDNRESAGLVIKTANSHTRSQLLGDIAILVSLFGDSPFANIQGKPIADEEALFRASLGMLNASQRQFWDREIAPILLPRTPWIAQTALCLALRQSTETPAASAQALVSSLLRQVASLTRPPQRNTQGIQEALLTALTRTERAIDQHTALEAAMRTYASHPENDELYRHVTEAAQALAIARGEKPADAEALLAQERLGLSLREIPTAVKRRLETPGSHTSRPSSHPPHRAAGRR